MRRALGFARTPGFALWLAALVSISVTGCTTTRTAVSKAWGAENGLLVRAVASVDQAWLVPNRGLLLYGEVMPGRLLGDPIRYNEKDDPPTAAFVAALTPKELASKRPRLHYDRFHAVSEADRECMARLPQGDALSTKDKSGVLLMDPKKRSLWQLQLDQQHIEIGELEDIGKPNDVSLGPTGGDWLYYLVVPLTLVWDGATGVVDLVSDYVVSPVAHFIQGPPPPAVAVAAASPVKAVQASAGDSLDAVCQPLWTKLGLRAVPSRTASAGAAAATPPVSAGDRP